MHLSPSHICVKQVSCPYCNVKAGTKCVNWHSDGYAKSTHKTRYDLYIRLLNVDKVKIQVTQKSGLIYWLKNYDFHI